MRAMVLGQPRTPLVLAEMPMPEPGRGEVLLRVTACAVCRTDLHVIDGELPHPKLPLIPGHEIIGRIEKTGDRVHGLNLGDRVGVPWLGWTCGICEFCLAGRENLCDQARFTGYTLDGGYADYAIADARFCFAVPEGYSDAAAAPLLCAGLIGYRSWRKAPGAKRLGIYGFGAAAHIVAQVARYHQQEVYAFTRPGDLAARQFALSQGAVWAGDSTSCAGVKLDAAIIFASAGQLVPQALSSVRKGGVVVCGGIHMTDIPSFPYELLWQERSICSVANLTRRDGMEFMALAPRIPVKTEVRCYPLASANKALCDLRSGNLTGAAVLVMD